MLLEMIISIGSTTILLPWILLIVFPNWRGTQWCIHSVVIPVLIGALYVWLYVTGVLTTDSSLSGNTVEDLIALYSVPEIAVAAWVHFVVFDLFVGAWQVRDAGRRGIKHLWVVPCLLLTLFAGPLGLMLYLGVRSVMKRGGFLLDEQVVVGSVD